MALALLPVIAVNPVIAVDLVALSWAFLGMGAVLHWWWRHADHAQHQPPPAAGEARPDAVHRLGPADL